MRRRLAILALAVAALGLAILAGPSLYGRWLVGRALSEYARALASQSYEDDQAAHEELYRAYQEAIVYAPELGQETRYRLLPLLTGDGAAMVAPDIAAICPPNDQNFELAWLLKQARGYVATGREARAEAIYRWLGANCPDSFEVYLEWATLEEARGDHRAGIGLLERAVTKTPRMLPPELIDKPETFWQAIALAGAYSDLGDLLYKDQQVEAAIVALERAVALHPPGTVSPWLYNFMGIVYFEAGRMDQSRQAFERALELKPDLPDAPAYLERIEARQ